MKKWIITLVALLMLFTVSHADKATEEELIQIAQSLLTEVYGYTQEEADSFTYNISDEDKLWLVRFYQSTSWVYEAKILKSDLSFSSYKTPFGTSSVSKASENSVRALLHEMEENDWFSKWNADSKQALGETLAQYSDIHINNSMDRGLQTDGYTPAQALEDFFLSCYGERAYWSPKTLVAWRNATFEAFGLDGNVPFAIMQQGI